MLDSLFSIILLISISVALFSAFFGEGAEKWSNKVYETNKKMGLSANRDSFIYSKGFYRFGLVLLFLAACYFAYLSIRQ